MHVDVVICLLVEVADKIFACDFKIDYHGQFDLNLVIEGGSDSELRFEYHFY